MQMIFKIILGVVAWFVSDVCAADHEVYSLMRGPIFVITAIVILLAAVSKELKFTKG
jgi:hypothetical protein